HRAHIKKVLLPAQNRKDMEDVPKEPQRTMKFVFVDHIGQVLKEALGEPAPQPAPLVVTNGSKGKAARDEIKAKASKTRGNTNGVRASDKNAPKAAGKVRAKAKAKAKR